MYQLCTKKTLYSSLLFVFEDAPRKAFYWNNGASIAPNRWLPGRPENRDKGVTYIFDSETEQMFIRDFNKKQDHNFICQRYIKCM